MSITSWCSCRSFAERGQRGAVGGSRSGSAARGAEPAKGRHVTRSPSRATSSSGLAPTKRHVRHTRRRPRSDRRDSRRRRGRAATSRRRMMLASSGASAISRSARASTTLLQGAARSGQLLACACDPGAVFAGAGTASAIRTAGSGPVGQSGRPAVRRTARGAISAAGLSTSKGNAPNTIGASPERSAACASRDVAIAGLHAVGDQGAGRPAQHERWFGACSPGRDRLRMAGQPERSELAYAVLEPAHRDRAGDHPKRLPSTSGSSTQRVITEREKWPWPDEHHVAGLHVRQRQRDGPVGAAADLRDALAAGASVRPDQPVGHRFADLRGGRGPRSRRNPIRRAGATPRRRSGRPARR